MLRRHLFNTSESDVNSAKSVRFSVVGKYDSFFWGRGRDTPRIPVATPPRGVVIFGNTACSKSAWLVSNADLN